MTMWAPSTSKGICELLLGVQAALVIVVAVEGDVDRTGRNLQAERRMQAFGDPDAAGVDADQCGTAGSIRGRMASISAAQRASASGSCGAGMGSRSNR
jgi:hypothetical protein